MSPVILESLNQEVLDASTVLSLQNLGLVGDVKLGNLVLELLILTSQHLDECRFSGSVLSDQDSNLRVIEGTRLNRQLELDLVVLGESFHHSWVFESVEDFLIKLVSILAHLEIKLVISESHIFSGDKSSQENIDTFSDRVGHGDDSVNGLLTVQATDVIGEIVQDGEIVLDDDDVVLLVIIQDLFSDNSGSCDSLSYVEVGGWFIKHQNFSRSD